MTDLTTSQVLDKAADLIEERGWTDGPFGWPDDRVKEGGALCLEGGIMAALGLDMNDVGRLYEEEDPRSFRFCPAYNAVRDYLGSDLTHIYEWNDKRGRTQHEVVATLRAASAVASTHTAGLPGSPVSA